MKKKINKTYLYKITLEDNVIVEFINSIDTPDKVIDGIIGCHYYVVASPIGTIIHSDKIIKIDVKEIDEKCQDE